MNQNELYEWMMSLAKLLNNLNNIATLAEIQRQQDGINWPMMQRILQKELERLTQLITTIPD